MSVSVGGTLANKKFPLCQAVIPVNRRWFTATSEMQLRRPLGSAKLGPFTEAGAELNHCRIQADEFVPEAETFLAEIQGPTLAQELVTYPLVQLPWPVFVRLG